MKKRVDGWGKWFQGGGAMKNLSDKVASKRTAKNRFLSLVNPATKGVFRDNNWSVLNQIIRSVRALGGEAEIMFSAYQGDMSRKEWFVEITANGFSFTSVFTATFLDRPNGDVYDFNVTVP